MITFPRSRIIEFYKHRNEKLLSDPNHKHLRLGQDFYHFFDLEKVTNAEDKKICEKIYHGTTTEANWVIIKRTDWEN